MSDELGLSVNGLVYKGWQSVQVTASIEAFARTFNISYHERSLEDGAKLPIIEGDACTVKLGDDKVITGYVDDADQTYDAQSEAATVAGRSAVGDLVDCAAIYKTGQWRGATLLKIATDLLDPFGLTAEVEGTAATAFRRFSIQDGETVHDCLERAARMRGFLLTSDAEGKLIFTRAGTQRVSTVIQRGVNVLRGGRKGSMRDRFSQYTLKAQAAGDDQYYGTAATGIKKSATDSGVKRYRPTIIQAENEDSGTELQERANWERNVRAGRARRLTYVVQGWRDDDGVLWEPNTLVRVSDSWFAVEDELLIVTVTFQKSLGGSTTVLELTRKEAFDVQPLPPAKPRGNGLFDEGV